MVYDAGRETEEERIAIELIANGKRRKLPKPLFSSRFQLTSFSGETSMRQRNFSLTSCTALDSLFTARSLSPMMEPVEKFLTILWSDRLLHLPRDGADPQQLGHC